MTQTVILKEPRHRALAAQLVMRAPDGFVVTIKEQTRTGEQNALMWCLLSDVSRSKPAGRKATPEVWKELFMHACGHATQFEMGLDGQPFPVGFRSSRLSKSQMGDLITFIQAWGAENGVQWSDEPVRDAA